MKEITLKNNFSFTQLTDIGVFCRRFSQDFSFSGSVRPIIANPDSDRWIRLNPDSKSWIESRTGSRASGTVSEVEALVGMCWLFEQCCSW
jgi:hypothetical protein